jgi:hypothetical protein
MNLNCSELEDGTLYCEELKNPQMFVIDGHELTPLEVSQLAYYFALNWDETENQA